MLAHRPGGVVEAAILLMSGILLVAVDQWMKAFVISWLPPGRTVPFGVVTIRAVLNQRVYWRSVRGARMMLALLVAEVVLFVAAVWLGPFLQGVVAPVALGAALGGAASNFLDSLWRGGVVDFVDFGFWPVFNLADVAIVTGVLTAVLCI